MESSGSKDICQFKYDMDVGQFGVRRYSRSRQIDRTRSRINTVEEIRDHSCYDANRDFFPNCVRRPGRVGKLPSENDTPSTTCQVKIKQLYNNK